MTKGETIEYAIKKKCQEYSLVEWCEDWDITVDELQQFLTFGRTVFDLIEKDQQSIMRRILLLLRKWVDQ